MQHPLTQPTNLPAEGDVLGYVILERGFVFSLTCSRWSLEHTEITEKTIIFCLIRREAESDKPSVPCWTYRLTQISWHENESLSFGVKFGKLFLFKTQF